MTQAEFLAITNRLAELGEDPEELEYWELIYGSLSPEVQAQLDANLMKELAALESIAARTTSELAVPSA